MKSVSLIAALAAAIMIAPVAAQSQAAPSAATKTAAKPKYKRDLPAKLVKEAKVSESVAAEAALKAVPGGKISSVELEKEDGKFIYSYDITVAGKSGVDEVHVDALTGAVVGNVHETPKDEKAEAAKEAKEKKAPAKPKKP